LIATKLDIQLMNCHNNANSVATLFALNGYIRYVRNQKQGQREYGNRAIREESINYKLSLPDEEHSDS